MITSEKQLYLDAEFNGHEGQLISLAIINPDYIDDTFYEVVDWWKDWAKRYEVTQAYTWGTLDPWVQDNVIPFLNKKAIRYTEFQTKLVQYLDAHQGYTIYADWPYDFVLLLSTLTIMGTNKIPSKLIAGLKMELITTPDKHVSKIPHNAYEDACALYRNHMEMLENDKPNSAN